MRISYDRLWRLLESRSISLAEFKNNLKLNANTMTRLHRNENVSLSLLLRICDYLDCNIDEICDAVKGDN